MSGKKLIRWAGMAAVVSGVLSVVTDVIYFAAFGDDPTRVAAASSTWLVALLLSLVGAYLGLLGLVGVYSRQRRESGVLGLVAFVIASLGTVLNTGWLWAGTFVVPHLVDEAPAFLDIVDTNPSGLIAAGFMGTFLLFALGWALVGIASVRAKVMPQLAGWLLALGAILVLVALIAGIPFGTVVFGAALAWLGWWLWSEKESMSI